MDRAYIDSHNLIDEYARGKLSGNELEELEIYMLEHPEIVDDIEFAKGMQAALAKSDNSLFTEKRNHQIPSRRLSGAGHFLSKSNVGLGIAAALVISIVGNVLQFQNEKISDPGPMLPVAQVYDVVAVRGADLPPIEVRDGTVVVIIRLVFPGLSTVSVELQSNTDKKLRYSNTIPVVDGAANLVLNLRHLEPGIYSMRVLGSNPPITRLIKVP